MKRFGAMTGSFEPFYRKPSHEEMEKAKEKVLNDICDGIRTLANENPEEFFIIKEIKDFPVTNAIMSVGAKVFVPSATNKEIEE